MRPWEIPSIFSVSKRPSVNFSDFPCVCGTLRQLSVRPQHWPSTFRVYKRPSVKLPCDRCSLRQLSVQLRDIPSNFRGSKEPSVNFRHLFIHLLELLSTFCTAAVHLANFRQISCICRSLHQFSVRPWDILSFSIKFPCNCGTIHQLSELPRDFP